jgi:hypothetical protein
MVTKKTMHALAALSIVGGLLRVFGLMTPDVELQNIVMSQYVLWAILFEVAALNIKD